MGAVFSVRAYFRDFLGDGFVRGPVTEHGTETEAMEQAARLLGQPGGAVAGCHVCVAPAGPGGATDGPRLLRSLGRCPPFARDAA